MNYLQIGRYHPSQWYSYELIREHYGIRTAKRSGVPLINHIHEGLLILNAESANEVIAQAYCLHPLIQSDDTMESTMKLFTSTSRGQNQRDSLLLALEYRGIANSYLSHHYREPVAGDVYPSTIKLSPMAGVNQMLRADKIQNRKDFEQYHQDTHPDSRRLEAYFKEWFTALSISDDWYEEACRIIDDWKRATTDEISNHDV